MVIAPDGIVVIGQPRSSPHRGAAPASLAKAHRIRVHVWKCRKYLNGGNPRESREFGMKSRRLRQLQAPDSRPSVPPLVLKQWSDSRRPALLDYKRWHSLLVPYFGQGLRGARRNWWNRFGLKGRFCQ